MRPARVAGGVVKLGSAIGEVCCARAGDAAPVSSAARATPVESLNLVIERVYLVPLIPAQAGIRQLGPRFRGDER